MLINGTHVEGMTSTQEVVDIIKGITGDLNVVAKRGDVTPDVPVNPNEAPPGNGEWHSFLIDIKNISIHFHLIEIIKAPPGGVWGTLKYVGPETKCNACMFCIFCGVLVSFPQHITTADFMLI